MNLNPIVEGSRTAAELHGKGVALDAIEKVSLHVNAEQCQPPLVTLRGIKLSSDPTPTSALTDVKVTVDEKPIPYPQFPAWVMHGTSIYDGFVKPICDVNSRCPEFMFMPALTLLMNHIGCRVSIADSSVIPSLFLVLVGQSGAFKTSSVQDAVDYFRSAGLVDWASPRMKTADGRSLMLSGSPENAAAEMARLSCNNGVMIYGEFLVKQGHGDNTACDLRILYESGLFVTESAKKSYVLTPNSYCMSLVGSVREQDFYRQWQELSKDSDLDDQFFFLYQPELLKPLRQEVIVNTAEGAEITKQRIIKAINQRVYKIGDPSPLAEVIETLGARTEQRAEKFALAFAVDLGRTEIDADCIERGLALARYEQDAKSWLKGLESLAKEGDVQQLIIRKLRQFGGSLKLRQLEKDLHARDYGTLMWDRSINGLLRNGYIVVHGTGKKGNAREVILLKTKEPKC